MPSPTAAPSLAAALAEAAPAQGGGADELGAYLASHPAPEVVEVLLPDTHGVLRGKWLPGPAAGKIWSEGVAIPSSIFGLDVWGREVEETGIHIETGDKDGLCRPVPGSLKSVPWARRPSAQVLLTMHEPDGTPWVLDPRHRLQDQIDRLAALGLHPCVAFELEFYLFRQEPGADGVPVPVFAAHSGPARQNMYAMSDLDAYAELLHEVREAARIQGLPTDTVISEAAPGQYEVNLYHRTDAMAAADDAILLRRLIDGVARRHGLRASFMAKPFLDFAGSGMHVHVSLMDRAGTNVFGAEGGQPLLENAAAGLLATMADTAILYVPSFNGFRRLVPGSYAPTSISWGYDNRAVAVRVPNGPPKARRLEHRIAGADAHPHLVLAAILGGMLEGIEQRLPAPEPLRGNAYEAGAPRLSHSMAEATAHFARSAFVERAFGAEFQRVFAVMKEAELAAFERRINPLEYETYL